MAGRTSWLHTLCNEELVLYRFSEKRGDVPKDLRGIVVHDHFVSYYAKLDKVLHALCNAHHLRELKAVAEIDKEPWAKNMTRLLLLGWRFATEKRHDIDDKFSQEIQNFIQQNYQRRIRLS